MAEKSSFQPGDRLPLSREILASLCYDLPDDIMDSDIEMMICEYDCLTTERT